MARERRNRGSDILPEPDTLPLMNIIFMLILSLLTMASLLPLGFLSSEAQKLSTGTAGITEEEKEKKNPLNLIVFITDDGFNFSVQGTAKMGVQDPSNPNRKLALVPKVLMPNGLKEYDFERLKEKLAEFKKIDPVEESMTITADPEVPFDAVIQTMDWSRFENVGGEKKSLFPKVSFAAGLVG